MKQLNILLLLLILTACNKLKEGKVISKETHEAYSTIIFIPMTSCVNNICTTTLMPLPVFYPESYSVTIRGLYKGEIRQETFYIDISDYNKWQVGENVCVNNGCTDRPYVEK